MLLVSTCLLSSQENPNAAMPATTQTITTMEQLEDNAAQILSELTTSIGFATFTGQDEAFVAAGQA